MSSTERLTLRQFFPSRHAVCYAKGVESAPVRLEKVEIVRFCPLRGVLAGLRQCLSNTLQHRRIFKSASIIPHQLCALERGPIGFRVTCMPFRAGCPLHQRMRLIHASTTEPLLRVVRKRCASGHVACMFVRVGGMSY